MLENHHHNIMSTKFTHKDCSMFFQALSKDGYAGITDNIMKSFFLDKSMMVSFELGFQGRKVNISSSSVNSLYLITCVHLFCSPHISFNQLVILFNLLTLIFNVQALFLLYLPCYEIYLSHILICLNFCKFI